jgi:hypothetical protein
MHFAQTQSAEAVCSAECSGCSTRCRTHDGCWCCTHGGCWCRTHGGCSRCRTDGGCSSELGAKRASGARLLHDAWWDRVEAPGVSAGGQQQSSAGGQRRGSAAVKRRGSAPGVSSSQAPGVSAGGQQQSSAGGQRRVRRGRGMVGRRAWSVRMVAWTAGTLHTTRRTELDGHGGLEGAASSLFEGQLSAHSLRSPGGRGPHLTDQRLQRSGWTDKVRDQLGPPPEPAVQWGRALRCRRAGVRCGPPSRMSRTQRCGTTRFGCPANKCEHVQFR